MPASSQAYLSLIILAPSSADINSEICRLVNVGDCRILSMTIQNMGSDIAATISLKGKWNNIEKVKNHISAFESNNHAQVVHTNTTPYKSKIALSRYTISIIAATALLKISEITQFLANRDIIVHNITVSSEKTSITQTTTSRFSMTILIPSEQIIADFHADFENLCADLNVDAIIEPEV